MKEASGKIKKRKNERKKKADKRERKLKRTTNQSILLLQLIRDASLDFI